MKGLTVGRLAKVDEEYVRCRSWGHQWDDFQPLRRRAAWGTLLSLRCERCSTQRHDTIDSRGEVSSRQYVYPEGYEVAGLSRGDRITAPELRREILTRMRRGEKRKNNVVPMRRRVS